MNIDHDDPRLVAAAEAIASHEVVDWHLLHSECDGQVVDSLRTIEKLVNQFSIQEPLWPRVGASWNHLEIKGEIGTGGDSVVYRAFDKLLNRDVALKLRFPRAQSSEAKLAEGQRMARIDHPNVLKVHGVAESNGLLGLWSDLIEGESLAKWVEEGKRLGSTELITLGTELCSALAAIHGSGLIHGDIKPANVVRDSNGRFVLVDFGASVFILGADKICGTPLYLAPEVLKGGPPTVASDIYGLGALLFRLATAKPPVSATSFSDLIAGHRELRREKLMDLRPDLPLKLIAAIESALNPDPAIRPTTAGEFAAQLADCLPNFKRFAPLKVAAVGLLLLGVGLVGVFSLRTPSSVAGSVKFVRTSGTHELPLTDGAAIAPSETFALDISPSQSVYAYVLDEDAHGESFQLFPLQNADIKNPLAVGKKVRLPGRVDGKVLDWQITSHGGTERLYVLLSQHPIAEFESGKKLDLASYGRSLEYAGELASGPQRGAGGLEAHKPSTHKPSVLGALIQKMLARDPNLHIEQIELSNP